MQTALHSIRSRLCTERWQAEGLCRAAQHGGGGLPYWVAAVEDDAQVLKLGHRFHAATRVGQPRCASALQRLALIISAGQQHNLGFHQVYCEAALSAERAVVASRAMSSA